MRLEDYIDTNLAGNGLRYTNGIISADEELLAHELGDRVVGCVLETAIDGWDALLDLQYAEEMRER